MDKQRDILKLYRDINGLSYLLIFDDMIARYRARDYEHKKPDSDTHLPCELIPLDKWNTMNLISTSEYVGDLVVDSIDAGESRPPRINFILTLIANPSFKLDSYMEEVIRELSDGKYSIQNIPTIKLSYMGIREKDNHLFE